MKKLLLFVLSLVTLAATAAPLTDADFLKAKGRNLRKNNGTGNIVQLRGTNLGGWLTQEFWMTPTVNSTGVNCERDIYNKLTERFGASAMEEIVAIYQDNYIQEADFDRMAAMGMNCIRLPFWWRNLTDASGNLKANAFKYLDWTIAMAKERGMYVVIDFHGAPGSQNGSDHSGVDGGDDKKGASQFFFGGNAAANQELYYSLWETIATRYKDEPAVAGYDLLNEPYCTYRYNSGYSADYLHSLLWGIYNNVYQRIRAVDPNHVIIMEATWDPVDLPNPTSYGWTNVMYEYHNYLYDDYDNYEGRQISNMQSKLNAIKAAAYDVPSYMGEFCYFNQLSAWDEGLALLDNSGINWTTWTYKVISTYGNWGLVNQNVPSVNLSNDSQATIRTNYARVGEGYSNTGLVEVASKYFRKAANKNIFGPAESEVGAARYESEQATIHGGIVEEQGFYSMGKGAGNMNSNVAVNDVAADWNNIKYVAYTITAEHAGNYTVTLAYNGAGAEGMASLYQVNGGASQPLTLNNGGASWDAMNFVSFPVVLQAGTNTLRIAGTLVSYDHWANQDYIEVAYMGLSIDQAQFVTAPVREFARTSSPNLGGWRRYEAESASLYGGEVQSQAFYSAGKGVGAMNVGTPMAEVATDWSNVKYVKFEVTVPTTATYRVLLQYNGDDDKTILVRTSEALLAVSIPAVRSGHDWDVVHVALLDIPMAEGTNTLAISGTINDHTTWLNIDCIDVCQIPLTAHGEYTRYEAEYGVIKANRAVGEESQSFYSNLWGVGGMGSNVALANVKDDLSNVFYTQFPIYADVAGSYIVRLAYNGNGNNMTAKYKLNEGAATTYTMSNAGRSWDYLNFVELKLALQEGMNTITFAGSSTGSWDDWVNFDYVDVKLYSASVCVPQSDEVLWQAYGGEGAIHITTEKATAFHLYSLSGRRLQTVTVEQSMRIPLTQGLYVVVTDSKAVKVKVW